MRRPIQNGSQRVANRCLYRSEESFFRGTLTTPAARELNVALGDPMGGEFRLKHEDDWQHTFTGGLKRVHKTVDYAVNNGRERIHNLVQKLFRAPRVGDQLTYFRCTVRRSDGTPAGSAGRSRAVFSSLRSWRAGGVHPLALFDDERAISPSSTQDTYGRVYERQQETTPYRVSQRWCRYASRGAA